MLPKGASGNPPVVRERVRMLLSRRRQPWCRFKAWCQERCHLIHTLVLVGEYDSVTLHGVFRQAAEDLFQQGSNPSHIISGHNLLVPCNITIPLTGGNTVRVDLVRQGRSQRTGK